MSNYLFKLARADRDTLSCHLKEVSDTFTPPLDTYVAIDEYVEKLFTKAQHCLAFDHLGNLVGLIAFYLDTEISRAFVSNVSISPKLQGKGLGKEMFEYFQEQILLNECCFSMIELEVRAENKSAISFYENLDFYIYNENRLVVSMRKDFN